MTEPEAPLPPRGTVVAYDYEAAVPTPRTRTQLVLVTGYSDPGEDGARRVLGVPIGHTDEQASFELSQLKPAP